MNAAEVEERVSMRAPQVGKSRLLRSVLLSIAASYVIVSLYLIFDTRNTVATLARTQRVAISDLRERQASTKRDFAASGDALSEQLAMTERELQAAYGHTAAELRQNQTRFQRRMQDQQNALMNQLTGDLKRLDPGKSRFAVSLIADDATVERKDRSVKEPLEFYTGGNRFLY